MKYRITFNHGRCQELEGETLHDDGLRLTVQSGSKQLIIHDADVASVEQIDMPAIEAGDTGERGGYRLYAEGRMVAAYRTSEAARRAA